jgi:hypothetical protein
MQRAVCVAHARGRDSGDDTRAMIITFAEIIAGVIDS